MSVGSLVGPENWVGLFKTRRLSNPSKSELAALLRDRDVVVDLTVLKDYPTRRQNYIVFETLNGLKIFVKLDCLDVNFVKQARVVGLRVKLRRGTNVMRPIFVNPEDISLAFSSREATGYIETIKTFCETYECDVLDVLLVSYGIRPTAEMKTLYLPRFLSCLRVGRRGNNVLSGIQITYPQSGKTKFATRMNSLTGIIKMSDVSRACLVADMRTNPPSLGLVYRHSVIFFDEAFKSKPAEDIRQDLLSGMENGVWIRSKGHGFWSADERYVACVFTDNPSDELVINGNNPRGSVAKYIRKVWFKRTPDAGWMDAFMSRLSFITLYRDREWDSKPVEILSILSEGTAVWTQRACLSLSLLRLSKSNASLISDRRKRELTKLTHAIQELLCLDRSSASEIAEALYYNVVIRPDLLKDLVSDRLLKACDEFVKRFSYSLDYKPLVVRRRKVRKVTKSDKSRPKENAACLTSQSIPHTVRKFIDDMISLFGQDAEKILRGLICGQFDDIFRDNIKCSRFGQYVELSLYSLVDFIVMKTKISRNVVVNVLTELFNRPDAANFVLDHVRRRLRVRSIAIV